MRRSLFCLALAAAAPCGFACPVAAELIGEYGISFSGFRTPIPKVDTPRENGAREADLILIRLPNPAGPVPDGFSHSALINTSAKRAWIRRIGGFINHYEWYGPVTLNKIDLKGCVIEQLRTNT